MQMLGARGEQVGKTKTKKSNHSENISDLQDVIRYIDEQREATMKTIKYDLHNSKNLNLNSTTLPCHKKGPLAQRLENLGYDSEIQFLA